jgi:hypothetical protein
MAHSASPFVKVTLRVVFGVLCYPRISAQVQNPCGTGVPFAEACVPFDDAYKAAYAFLLDNLPSYDATNKATLGFHSDEDVLVDGLDSGVATLGINISLATKQASPWAWTVPQDVFNEYVAAYAWTNEGRTDWRPFLGASVASVFEANTETDLTDITSVVSVINAQLWNSGALGRTVVFKSAMTPLIYDPMSVVAYGYASCTGVSIVFAGALRAAGIPARLAGTPAWNGAVANGNHNWVEVWLEDGSWYFIEAAPAGGGETLANPCDKWFCSGAKMNGTSVFAARWARAGTVYPLAWDPKNSEVPGVDRTSFYQEACGAC